MSNSLDPDQADILSGLIWVQAVCKDQQQSMLAGKELNSSSQMLEQDDGGGGYMKVSINLL